MNKRGGDKILSVYWFVVLFIIAGGIIYMTYSFYGKPYDIRPLETNALTNAVAKCISENGYFDKSVLTSEFSNELLERCDLTFEVEDAYDWRSQGQFYVQIRVFDFSSGDEVSKISSGNEALKDFCELEGKYMPLCLERNFYSADRNGNQYKINILSIVKKADKNA